MEDNVEQLFGYFSCIVLVIITLAMAYDTITGKFSWDEAIKRSVDLPYNSYGGNKIF